MKARVGDNPGLRLLRPVPTFTCAKTGFSPQGRGSGGERDGDKLRYLFDNASDFGTRRIFVYSAASTTQFRSDDVRNAGDCQAEWRLPAP